MALLVGVPPVTGLPESSVSINLENLGGLMLVCARLLSEASIDFQPSERQLLCTIFKTRLRGLVRSLCLRHTIQL